MPMAAPSIGQAKASDPKPEARALRPRSSLTPSSSLKPDAEAKAPTDSMDRQVTQRKINGKSAGR
jgi:hypothetical protein